MKGGDGEADASKLALWRELAEAGFARTASAIWLLPLLQLLLRVQLNILGRQLFMESNLLEPRYILPRTPLLRCGSKCFIFKYAAVLKRQPSCAHVASRKLWVM